MKGEDLRRRIEAMAMRRRMKRVKLFKRQSRKHKVRLEKREVAPRSPPDDDEEEEATTDVNEYEDNDMDYASEINNDEPVYDEEEEDYASEINNDEPVYDEEEEDYASEINNDQPVYDEEEEDYASEINNDEPVYDEEEVNEEVNDEPVYDEEYDEEEEDYYASEINDEPVYDDDEEEDYYWTNFIGESSKVFDSKEALIDFFENNFPRVCHKITLGGSGFYLKKEHKGLLNNYAKVEELDKACSFLFRATNMTSKGFLTQQVVTLPLGSVLKQSRVPSYSHVICDPKATDGMTAFNTWRPLRADIKRDDIGISVNRIISYMKEVICDLNRDMFDYLMTWLCQVCLFPEKQTRKVLVFQSSSDAGELFVNWLSKYVFGSYSADRMSLEEVEEVTNKGKGKGNDKGNHMRNNHMRLMSKVFVCIDGLPTTTSTRTKFFDSLNYLRRGAEIDMKDFKINNLLNFVVLTKPMRLEPDDKERYVNFTIDGGRRLEEYGDNLFTEDSAIDFFNYLRRVSSSQYSEKDLNVIPMSADLNVIPMSAGMNSMESFLKEVKERTLNDTITLFDKEKKKIHEIPVNEKVMVRKKDLFAVYEKYCDSSGKQPYLMKKFNDYLVEKRKGEGRYYLV